MIAEPPVTPAANETTTCPRPAATPVIVGAPGDENGVTELDDDPFPAPAMLTARICTAYAVPFTKLATTSGLVMVPAEIHDDPAFTLYS